MLIVGENGPIDRGALATTRVSEGSEAGGPLRAHAFRDSEREGAMVTPIT